MDDFDGSAVRAIKAAGGATWSSYHKEVNVDSIKLAHELGLSVNVWTVNDPGRMRELIAMGVDGIITDYPDRLRQVLTELGMPLPVGNPGRLLTAQSRHADKCFTKSASISSSPNTTKAAPTTARRATRPE